jgi:tRNA dimethylallyltransferase
VTKVVFILGCTAVGKGAIGRALARRIGGQIVSVDSMKVYRRMDIGTAKPTAAVRAEIPHHCIDLVEPSESFSVAQYVTAADAAIATIAAAGARALAVGGTSLYIKALSEGLFQGPSADPALREQLKRRAAAEGLDLLHAELAAVDADSAARIHPRDQRRIIRALEVYQATGTPLSRLQNQWDSGRRRYECVFLGLRRGREDLHRRINARVKRMVAAGLEQEVAGLLAEPAGLSIQATAAVGYAEMIAYLRGRITREQAVERIAINTRHLAKKQRTWHRRWAEVRWFDLAEGDNGEAVAEEILAAVDIGR